MSASTGTNSPRQARRVIFGRVRALLWTVLGVATLWSGQWWASLLCVVLLLNELAILKWGGRARIARAGVELGGVALFLLVTGIVLLTRQSFFLGLLCIVGGSCIALVLGTVGSALRRRGYFHHSD